MAAAISWSCATASERGSSHVLDDTENQDSATTFETDDGVAVAVADGHGGRRYTRSATGSAIAVEVARQLAAEMLRSDADLLEAATTMPPRIVDEWRRRVDQHLATHPLEHADAALIGDDPRLAYGATLLIVVCRRDRAVALQLGDGDVAVAWDDETVTSPVPDEPRNVGGHTTSLCLPDAERSFRVAELGRGAALPVAILAATDGYGNSFEHDDWAQAVMRDLLAQRQAGALESIFSAMSSWVAESARVGGDDTTVALVFRSGASTAVPAAAPPRATVPAMHRPRRWVAPAIAGILGVAAGTAFGVTAAGDGESRTVAVTTSPRVPSTDVPTTPIATRPPASTAPPSNSPPTTPASSAPTTVPPASTTTSAATTLPPVVDQVAPADRSVVMAVGLYRLELDPFSDPIVVVSFGPTDGATPIRQVLTPGGRWDAVDATLRFTPGDGSPTSAWESDGPGRVALAFSAGRVVAAAVTADDDGEDVVAVRVFDGTTGDELAADDQAATNTDD